MKILVASPLLYHAACGSGGGLICWRFLRALAEQHEVALVAFSTLPASEEALAKADLGAFCRTVQVLPLPEPSAASCLRARASQWLGGPPTEARAFDVPAMRAALRDVAARFKPDVLLLQFPYMAQYAGVLPGVATVADVQDVFFVSRLREYAAQRQTLPRLKRQVAWLAWTRYEMRWYSRCQALMALTEPDRHALHALVPEVPAHTVPAVVESRVGAELAPAEHLVVGFGGHFGHAPNLDGLIWLNTEIAPLLAARVPGVRIIVAGKAAPESVRRNLHPAIGLEGFVDDYDRFVARCSVFLAPMRFGGGVKVKVLEALSCARPVVTTPVGGEGIDVSADDGLRVVVGANALVAATAAWLEAPAAAAAAGRRGAATVARRFGAASAVQRFEALAAPLRLSTGRAGSADPASVAGGVCDA